MKRNVCAVCGELFPPRNSRHRCCGPACSRELKRRASAAWYEANRGYQIRRVVDRRRNKQPPAVAGGAEE